MIVAGVKLAFLGMGVVISFLLLLVFIVTLSCKLLSPSSEKELLAMEMADREKRQRTSPGHGDDVLIAVISAAIAAHRSRA